MSRFLRIPLSSLLALFLGAQPLRAQPVRVEAPIARSNVQRETARTLEQLAPSILKIKHDDGDKRLLALAFARLGRVEEGLLVADVLEDQSAALRGGPQTRDEVRRVGVRVRALTGDIAGSRALAAHINNSDARADALLAIARAQIRVGDVAGAQQTLFSALSLEPGNVAAQVYIATLLDRANAPDAAKRLLARVEKSIPLPRNTKLAAHDLSEGDRKNWISLGRGFLRAHRWDDAERVVSLAGGLDRELTDALLDAKRFDIALVRAQNQTAQNLDERTGRLDAEVKVAWAWTRDRPSAAAPLIRALSPQVQQLPLEFQRDPHTFYTGMQPEGFYKVRRAFLLVRMAVLLREIGDEPGAQTLLNTVSPDQVLPGEGTSYWNFYLALSPVLLKQNFFDVSSPTLSANSPLSREQVERTIAEVEPFIKNPPRRARSLRLAFPLVDAAIEAGERDAARRLLVSLEPAVLEEENKEGSIYLLGGAFDLARKWQKMGDATGLQEYLTRLWNSPVARLVAPRTLAVEFIKADFIAEGETHLAQLGVARDAAIEGRSPAYYEAKLAPDTLPSWIGQQPDAPRQLEALCAFVMGLTEPKLESSEESEFIQSAAFQQSSF